MGNNVSSGLQEQISNYKKGKLNERLNQRRSVEAIDIEKTRNSFFSVIAKEKNNYSLSEIKKSILLNSDRSSEKSETLYSFSELTSIYIDSKTKRKKLNKVSAFNLYETEKSLNECDMFEFEDDISTNESLYRTPTMSTLQSAEMNPTFDFNIILLGEKIRKSYISKLLLKNELQLGTKSRTFNSIIIFDWDDTLFPTTRYSPLGLINDKILTESEKVLFLELENTVCKLISIATSKADTYIITNANKSWIYFSSKKYYYNKAERILEKVNIISARNEYEQLYPGDNSRWKLNAFFDTSKHLNKKLLTNIISIGDSLMEISSAHKLGETFNNAYTKTLKLKENPSVEELQQQLNLIIKQFDTIYCSQKNLNIKLGQRKTK